MLLISGSRRKIKRNRRRTLSWRKIPTNSKISTNRSKICLEVAFDPTPTKTYLSPPRCWRQSWRSTWVCGEEDCSRGRHCDALVPATTWIAYKQLFRTVKYEWRRHLFHPKSILIHPNLSTASDHFLPNRHRKQQLWTTITSHLLCALDRSRRSTTRLVYWSQEAKVGISFRLITLYKR